MSNVYDDHAQALLALLRANTVLADMVYDGDIPGRTRPPEYVLVYLSIEFPKGAPGTSLDGASSTAIVRATCHCVAADAIGARAMSAQVALAWKDIRPTVPGRDCDLIVLDTAPPPTRDETTGVPVMDAVNVYRLTTYPA